LEVEEIIKYYIKV